MAARTITVGLPPGVVTGQWSAHQRNERYTWQSTAANNVWAPGVYGWKSA